jgi:nitroreductase
MITMYKKIVLSGILLGLAGCATVAQKDQNMKMKRIAEYPIEPLFIQRWSPRAMSGESVSRDELNSLLEAARWAPSSYNNQPWHFIYSFKGTPEWDQMLTLLAPANQTWCVNAGVLICIISAKNFFATGKPSRTHILDTGSAWENLALQGAAMGLIIHGMEGFNYDKARNLLNIPDDYDITMMVAVGRAAPKEALPPALQEREFPSDRLPISEISSEGIFTSTRTFKK